MKKLIIKLLFVAFFISGALIVFTSFNKDVEAGLTYFNPNIPFPEDPCDTGGQSVCYGNE